MLTCVEVQNRLSEYIDGDLTSEQRLSVEMHLKSCNECQVELVQVRNMLSAAASLPKEITPQQNLWPEIAHRIEKQSSPFSYRVVRLNFGESQGYDRQKSSRRLRVGFVFAAAAIVVAVILLQSNSQQVTGWNLEILEGSPQLSSHVEGSPVVQQGAELQTDGKSKARLRNSSIGSVIVEPRSSFRLLDVSSEEHRFALDRGVIVASTWVPPRIFVVETPSAVAIDLGCQYALRVKENGAGTLTVTAGWVALEWKDRQAVVPSDAMCEIQPGVGPGIPVAVIAPESLKLAVRNFAFGSDDQQHLSQLLDLTRQRDAVTLWHLLSRVDESDRGRVFDRLAEFIPPPKGVTREGILRLDFEMLDLWWEKFQYMRLSEFYPQPSSIERIWKKVRDIWQ